MKRIAALFPLLAISACSAALPDTTYTARSDVVVAPVVATAGGQGANDTTDAIMILPDQPVQRVREHHFVNGSRQEVILASAGKNHGENVIDVSIQTASQRDGQIGELQIGKPSEREIRNEILSRFPDVKMGIVTRPTSDAFGPIGVAIGRYADGTRCVFGWQWIDDIRDAAPKQSGFTRFGSLLSGQPSPVSIRIRICRADQTVDQLAAQLEGLRMGDPSALQRILTMDRRNIEPGPATSALVDTRRPVAAVAPLPESLEAAISAPVSARPTRVAAAPRHARKMVARKSAPREPDLSSLPSAPPPPMVDTPAPSYGPRYMAPVANAPRASAFAAAASPVPAPSAPRLETSLPPQAYRGPTGSQSSSSQTGAADYGMAPTGGR